jgi:predicted nucleic acid-binding protein
MKIYLDNCCFNRPFDNQRQLRIRLEAEAILYVQDKIIKKEFDLIWSYILDYENLLNPFEERKHAITDMKETKQIIQSAEFFVENNLNPKDALHIACAVAGKSDYFLTTDDGILSKSKIVKQIKIVNPLEFITKTLK